MTHYTNTNNPIDFPKKKKIPMLERFAAQSLVESDGELIFSKEKFAELIVEECVGLCETAAYAPRPALNPTPVEQYAFIIGEGNMAVNLAKQIRKHFGVEE